MTKTLFKFRTTDDKDKLDDILIHQRLFMSNYQKQMTVGDNKEGHYTHPALPQFLIEEIKKEKLEVLICSVTSKFKEKYMWQEYADNGKGLCIAFTVNDEANYKKVRYVKSLLSFTAKEMYNHKSNKLAIRILSHKLARFAREQEYRFMKQIGFDLPYLSIKIHTIYLGWEMDSCMADSIRSLVKEHHGSAIKVVQLRKPI